MILGSDPRSHHRDLGLLCTTGPVPDPCLDTIPSTQGTNLDIFVCRCLSVEVMDAPSTATTCTQAAVFPAVYIPISKLNSHLLSDTNSIDQSESSLISSLNQFKVREKMIRVIGTLCSYDIVYSKLLIQDSKDTSKSLIVNTSRIEPFCFEKGCLFQFIGELDTIFVTGTQSLMLKALLYRCVREMDVDVYERALALRMADLN